MEAYGLDAFIVTNGDPNGGEYPAEHWKARSWLSGFTGSNGTLVVTRSEAALWTDGRYYLQAESQLSGSTITLMRGGEPDTPEFPEWIAERLNAKDGVSANGDTAAKGAASETDGGAAAGGVATAAATGSSAPAEWKVGVNGRVTPCATYSDLTKAFAGRGIALVIEHDPVGELWTEGRPELPRDPIFRHGPRYAGAAAAEKLEDVRGELRRRDATCALISGLDDIAWLFNIRGGDVPNLPVAYAFALVTGSSAELYIDLAKVPDEVAESLRAEGVAVVSRDELAGRVAALGGGERLAYDPHKLNFWLLSRAPAEVRRIPSDEPTLRLKAVKNDAEIRNHRECQARDGAAMVRFLIWLEREAAKPQPTVNEWDAALALRRFRSEQPENRGESFPSIVGYGPHGAMMHYAPDSTGGARIENRGLMVVDSGGQYLGGTTDITRTIVFRETTAEERRDFTLTLKAHISLASSRFLYGAAGPHIDAFARKVMWDHGMDYKSGTGHGIGSFLSVHEGPHSISLRAGSLVRLEENMFVSIEPGVYRDGKHGVRIENLARIREDFTNEFGRFLCFEILSFCPISLAGVEPDMLDGAEKVWLNDYHRAVYDTVAPLLGPDEREWLKNATRPLL
jgi:Xaa-Pro aminopeptidase